MPDALSFAAAAVAAAPAPLTLASPALFAAAVVLALIVIAVAVVRRIALPRGAMLLMTLGLACACLGAGALTWNRRHNGHLAVVVDVSPSTATATFRDRRQLATRLDELLGDTPYTLYQLADGVARARSQSLEDLPREVPSRATSYAPPPAADAVVLFSDARFAPTTRAAATSAAARDAPAAPAAPQTFVVLDPALDHPLDAAVERLELRRGDTVVATISNRGSSARRVRFFGAESEQTEVRPGRFVIAGKIAPGTREVMVHLAPGDAWRANDALSISLPPPSTAQKWWIGQRPPPSSEWVHIDPADAPADLADYLAAAVIVLDNVAADAIAETPRLRLHQYVRDLGGGIVILGGDRAFAAGGYAGSPLEQLSPLASTPPRPAAQWLILADSSGSMARTFGDNSRWNFAVDAVRRVVPLLPGDDTISVGNFSQGLRWWIAGRSVRDAQANLAIPIDLRPHGPTNLAAALRLIADTADGALPTQLLLVTDAEAKIDDAAALADALAARQVRVSVLATADVPPNDPLRRIADRTGGRIATQSDPRQWTAELKQLLRAASPRWLGGGAMTIRFTEAGSNFPPQQVAPWNRTWLKRDATELAVGFVRGPGSGEARSGDAGAGSADGERVPAIAAWNVGAGAVIAAAFAPAANIVDALVDRVATPPRDPRFRVTHDAGRELRITLEAFDNRGDADGKGTAGGAGGAAGGAGDAGTTGGADGAGGGYLNNLVPRLELSRDATRASATVVPIPQTAPGRYAVSVPAPLQPMFATVTLNGRVLDRFAVAGRYAPEYDAIGNDRTAMESLARGTGGAVIEPAQTSPIDFRWPPRRVALAPYLAAAAAALVTAGLVRWRWVFGNGSEAVKR